MINLFGVIAVLALVLLSFTLTIFIKKVVGFKAHMGMVFMDYLFFSCSVSMLQLFSKNSSLAMGDMAELCVIFLIIYVSLFRMSAWEITRA